MPGDPLRARDDAAREGRYRPSRIDQERRDERARRAEWDRKHGPIDSHPEPDRRGRP